MIRVEYDLTCWNLKWTLSDKRWHRGFKFQPMHSVRDTNILRKKRAANWNKHTMGTE